jgi:homoserine dehydrogenase
MPASRSTGCGQYGHAGTTAPVLIVTHTTTQDAISHALSRFGTRPAWSKGTPVAIRIEAV